MPGARGYLKGKQASTGEILLEAKTLYEEWPKLNSDRKWVIVESVFERIEVKHAENGGVKLRIIYSGLPSSEEMCKNQQLMDPATGLRSDQIGALPGQNLRGYSITVAPRPLLRRADRSISDFPDQSSQPPGAYGGG